MQILVVRDLAPDWNTTYQLRALQHLVATLPGPTAPAVKRERTATPGTARRLKDDQVQELVAAYEAGSTVYQLADLFKINRRTVGEILKRQKVKTRWQRLTEADVDEAERLYAQGLSLARIGKQLDVSGGAVRLRLLRRGVQLRDRHDRS